jgi:hypothetical protein
MWDDPGCWPNSKQRFGVSTAYGSRRQGGFWAVAGQVTDNPVSREIGVSAEWPHVRKADFHLESHPLEISKLHGVSEDLFCNWQVIHGRRAVVELSEHSVSSADRRPEMRITRSPLC